MPLLPRGGTKAYWGAHHGKRSNAQQPRSKETEAGQEAYTGHDTLRGAADPRSTHHLGNPKETLGNTRKHQTSSKPAPPGGHQPPAKHYFEISSNATPRVFGPSVPMATITTTIAPEINTNTPFTPNRLKHPAITNAENIADIRLHE